MCVVVAIYRVRCGGAQRGTVRVILERVLDAA